PGIPQFGPDDSEFVTFDNDLVYGAPGITLGRWRAGTAEIVWRHGVELDPIYHKTALVRWNEPDVIQLELWSFAGPHWPAVARRGLEGWRLESKWPKLNCNSCRNPNFR